MDTLAQKGILISILSPLIKCAEVSIESTIDGHMVGFVANLIGIDWGKSKEAWITVLTDEGMAFGVSLANLKIEVIQI